ncbi:hypothetical protein GCM10025876_27580 [Demequina litorisediminis]|uniref:Uncharacterized protein n=1 Tax=Demequina litorisediminis TaxID=1849022 RepID=A0ABQ6IIM8_9MICO|nr:hypothetical protein GCM10025876_27580 [Demequina litorisediminis]
MVRVGDDDALGGVGVVRGATQLRRARLALHDASERSLGPGNVAHDAHPVAHHESAAAQFAGLDARQRGGVIELDRESTSVDSDHGAGHRIGVRGSLLRAGPRTLARADLGVGLVVAAPVAHAPSIPVHMAGKSGMVLAVVPTWITSVPGTASPTMAAKVAIRWSW